VQDTWQEGDGSDQVMTTAEFGCDHNDSVKTFGHGRS